MATTILNFTARGALVSDSRPAQTEVAAVATALAASDITGDAVNSAVATLVAAGASPTQGQVTTLAAAWAAYVTDVNTVETANAAAVAATANAGGGDVSVSVNSSAFTTKGQLIAALREAADVLAQLVGIK